MATQEQRTHHFEDHLNRLQSYIPLKGKRVVEIGSDRFGYVPKRLLELGAVSVEATNVGAYWPEQEAVSHQLLRRRVDANHLADHYSPSSVDVIFGMAVMEHIPRSWLFLEEANRVLRANGVLYVHGGPVWTGRLGHHLYTKVDDVEYHFPDPTCPIKPWEHLMHDEASLADVLRTRIPPSHADHIARWVYKSSEQNRYGYRRLQDIVERSPMRLIGQHNFAFGGPRPEEFARIRQGAWGDDDRFDVSGVVYVLTPVK